MERSSGEQTEDATADDTRNQLRDEEVLECPPQYGYKLSIWRCLIVYPIAVLPACTGLLLAYWFPSVWVWLTCFSCSLNSATWVVVQDMNRKWRVEKVQQFSITEESEDNGECNISAVTDHLLGTSSQTVKFFIHQHLRYLFDNNKGQYVLLRGYEKGLSCNDLHKMRGGLLSQDHQCRLTYHGLNNIDVPVKPYHVLFIEEILHPFYIFQIYSIIVWILGANYIYSGAIFIISVISIMISLIQTRRHMQQLHDMVITNTQVSVIRNEIIIHNVSSETLVPGDVLVVPRDGMMMPCDSVLLTGNAIVNEAMLTGESVPITKTPAPMEQVEYNPHEHKRHTLFAGTEVIQARKYSQDIVLAVVVRTSFLTSKGGMVRSILFPKPLNIKFYWDSIKFILILAVLAVFAFIYTILVLHLRNPPYQAKETILRAFDIVTTVVPPVLPAAITVGTIYALNRLKKHQIYCISPQRVNLCGKIKLVCFDKTGTLTEENLDVLGVQPTTAGRFSDMVHHPSEISHTPLFFAMATCHSIARIKGELSGDPLDLKMFLSTGWELEDPGKDDSHYYDLPLIYSVREPAKERNEEEDVQFGILKQFTFSSEMQRMSVLVHKLPSEGSQLIHVFVKGAPEMIKQLSHSQSIPLDFYQVLASLTQKGYRVLAFGYKTIQMEWHHAEQLERDAVECDLTFCGLLLMENKLKLQTFSVIHELQLASIRTVMITGDNLLTAIAVSIDSGMVASHHHVIVIKASKKSSNGSPSLSYHVIGSEGINQSLFLASTGTVGEVNSNILNVNQPLINAVMNGDSMGYQAVDTEHSEYFHLAVDGHTFSVMKEHYQELFERLLVCGTIFARMSPIQKAQLVTELMGIGYGVAMCGDGANDCGALKAAHAGISLSETEASVASPFTSKTPNITCVPILIKEGRDALVTSFSIFKFMALYSLIEFSSVVILYAIESNLGGQEYVYVDFVLILPITFVMGLTGPYPHLVKRRPIGTLAGIHVITSVLTQTVLMLAMQLGIFFYVQTLPWFEPLKSNMHSKNIMCWENTAVFTLSIFQYIALAIAFSTSAPYRKPLYTNYWCMLTLAILIPANLYIALAPQDWVPKFWSFVQVKPSPSLMFRITIVELAIVHFLIAYLLERYIFPSSCMHKFLRILRCKSKSRNRYKHIMNDVSKDTTWPPVLPFSLPAHY